jgi:hypothetical protein
MLAAPLASAGCTNATGTIVGGEYLLPTSNSSTSDGGVVEGGAPAPVPDLVLPDNCNDGGANAGSRWQDLYACYFGTSGVASCAGTQGMCHGDSTGMGAQSSGFVCPPGDSMACQMNMNSVLISGQPPKQTYLWGVLRQAVVPLDLCDQGNCMPKVPSTIVFGPDDMARIAAWIDAGSPNN